MQPITKKTGNHGIPFGRSEGISMRPARPDRNKHRYRKEGEEMIKKLNNVITSCSEKILKIICWENTEFNQQTISTILGWIFGCSLIIIFKFILA